MSAPDSRAISQDPNKLRAPDEASFLYHLCRAIARVVCTLTFDLKTFGLHNVPQSGGVLLVSNHQSYLDPLVLGVNIRRPMSFLAKSELFRNRFFGAFISALNAFPVRQGKGDKAAIDEMIRQLRGGHMLTLFPEGSRTDDGEIAPIQRGAALVVRRADVPIIPAVVHGSHAAWPKGQKLFRARSVRVLYGPALHVRDLKGDQIIELIDRTLRAMFDDLRAGRLKKYLPREPR